MAVTLGIADAPDPGALLLPAALPAAIAFAVSRLVDSIVRPRVETSERDGTWAPVADATRESDSPAAEAAPESTRESTPESTPEPVGR